MKLLIATTNKGKFREISSLLSGLDIEFFSLNDLKEPISAPDETELSIEGNAVLKAKYYGQKSGMITLSEDSGLFVAALEGYPGVISARIADTNEERISILLKKMESFDLEDQRAAEFRICAALYNPENEEFNLFNAKVDGYITKTPSQVESGFGYDPVFYFKEKNKTFAEMTELEKNSVSHRGKALQNVKSFLQKYLSPKQIVVPSAYIIRDNKILLSKRNDPKRPEYHEKWEFPGGGVEYKEQIEAALIREVKEEVGYDVQIVKLLSKVFVEAVDFASGSSYQAYIIPYLCKVIGGDGTFTDEESLEVKWFDLDEVLNTEMIGNSRENYKLLLNELKSAVRDLN